MWVWRSGKGLGWKHYENDQPIGTAEARHLEEYAHRGIRSMRRRPDNKIIMGKHSEKEQL